MRTRACELLRNREQLSNKEQLSSSETVGSEGIMGGLGQQEDEKLVEWLTKMQNMLIVLLCSVIGLFSNSQ